MVFQDRILFRVAPWVFIVESCVCLCREFSGWNPGYCAKCIFGHGNKYSTIAWPSSPISTLSPDPVPNVFPLSLFINPFYVHTVFERSTDKEWYNPFGTFCNGDPFEQNCLGVGNSKTRRTLRKQLTIIYSSMFKLHTVAQEREREREREREWVRERERERKYVGVYEQTQKEKILPVRLNSLKGNFWQLPDLLRTFSKFAIFYLSKFVSI